MEEGDERQGGRRARKPDGALTGRDFRRRETRGTLHHGSQSHTPSDILLRENGHQRRIERKQSVLTAALVNWDDVARSTSRSAPTREPDPPYPFPSPVLRKNSGVRGSKSSSESAHRGWRPACAPSRFRRTGKRTQPICTGTCQLPLPHLPPRLTGANPLACPGRAPRPDLIEPTPASDIHQRPDQGKHQTRALTTTLIGSPNPGG